MKYRGPSTSKLTHKHHMIVGLRPFLEGIESWGEIMAIHVGRIKRTKTSAPKCVLKVQYATPTGLKCLARSGAAVQEVFIVTSKAAELEQKIERL